MIGPRVSPKLHISHLPPLTQANSHLDMSLINNSSQANSEIAVAVPRVQFTTPEVARAMTCARSPVEVAPVLSTSNPDGHCRHRHHQRASRRFQQAGTAEVEFSTDFNVSLFLNIPIS